MQSIDCGSLILAKLNSRNSSPGLPLKWQIIETASDVFVFFKNLVVALELSDFPWARRGIVKNEAFMNQ